MNRLLELAAQYKTTLLWSAGGIGVLAALLGLKLMLDALIHNPNGISESGKSEFLWHVRVTSNGPPCGGSVIADDWVLTAAHCVSAAIKKGKNVYVMSGSKSRDGPRVKADKVIMHADFPAAPLPGKPRKYDIALIHVSIAVGTDIAVIEPATENHEGTTSNGYVAGWICLKPIKTIVEGALRLLTDCTRNLYHTSLGIPKFGDCADDPAFVCAGGNTDSGLPGIDANDSGGGLTTGTGNGAWLQGIAIHGGDSDKYTRVSQYLAWIADCRGGAGLEKRCKTQP